MLYAVKHTKRRLRLLEPKPVTFTTAFERSGLTQLELEERSGVDRTRISKLMLQRDPKVRLDTYEKLTDALRKCGALAPTEKLVFGRLAPVRQEAGAA